MGPIWPKVRGQAVPANQQKHKQVKKRKRKEPQSDQTLFFLCGPIFSKNEGSTAVRLLWYYEKSDKKVV